MTLIGYYTSIKQLNNIWIDIKVTPGKNN